MRGAGRLGFGYCAGRESGERDAVCVGGASCACVRQVVAPRAAFTSRSITNNRLGTWDLGAAGAWCYARHHFRKHGSG